MPSWPERSSSGDGEVDGVDWKGVLPCDGARVHRIGTCPPLIRRWVRHRTWQGIASPNRCQPVCADCCHRSLRRPPCYVDCCWEQCSVSDCLAATTTTVLPITTGDLITTPAITRPITTVTTVRAITVVIAPITTAGMVTTVVTVVDIMAVDTMAVDIVVDTVDQGVNG
ncbi:hypothetical protein PputUW4_01263 [Pseudomonas sp. UW4]|nr:hypothetical protein PputUW4_01263 [Pseudomonas sp. UW4]